MASVQDTELQLIKTNFTGRCRIVDGGEGDEFIRSITLQPKAMDLTITFQLKDNYPATLPKISVRSSSVVDEDIEEFIDVLKTKATSILNQPMIHLLMSEAEQWLHGKGVGRGRKTKKQNRNPQKKNKVKKNKDIEEEQAVKQASMKTSEDVIKRIQWDLDLPQEDFLVGYIDRFLGIQEKYFSAFSWEDISSVDYNVLAIPKHRIQYFKYKDVKVWDKTNKLDNVFGSLGSGKTITDIIKNYKPNDTNTNTQEAEINKSGNTENTSDGGDSDDDSDDGIVVTLDEEAVKLVSRPYLDHLHKRPTHFIALRIENPETVQRLTDVQERVKAQKPMLSSGYMPPPCFHVTLCTLGLDHQDQAREACNLLHSFQSELSKLRPSESLKLTGVDNFYNRTVYAKIKYPTQFLEFVDHLKQCFINAGIEIRDSYGFVPHITILKISKDDARQLGVKFLISDLYHEFKNAMLGSQSIDKLSLCIMGDQRQEDGFWVSIQDVDLNC